MYYSDLIGYVATKSCLWPLSNPWLDSQLQNAPRTQSAINVSLSTGHSYPCCLRKVHGQLLRI